MKYRLFSAAILSKNDWRAGFLNIWCDGFCLKILFLYCLQKFLVTSSMCSGFYGSFWWPGSCHDGTQPCFSVCSTLSRHPRPTLKLGYKDKVHFAANSDWKSKVFEFGNNVLERVFALFTLLLFSSGFNCCPLQAANQHLLRDLLLLSAPFYSFLLL